MHGFQFTDRLSPFLFHFHLFGRELGIRWYGLTYVLGFIAAYLYFRTAQQRGEIENFNPEAVESLTFSVPVGVVLGGRIGFVVQHPHELFTDPMFAIRIWEGGMAFFGGLAGALLAILWVVHRYKLRFLNVTDVAVFPATIGLALGRLANFVNGELVGKPTGKSWGVVFPSVDLLPRYPSQLFESVSHFIMLGMLLFVKFKYGSWAASRPGALSYLFLICYGVFRFFTDFYRDDDTYWGPFSDGQWFSIGVALLGVILIRYVLSKPPTASPHSSPA